MGTEVLEYAYYDAANHALDFDGLLNSLKQAQAGDVVLFHGCCHNPTGIDQRRSSGRSWPNFPSPTAGCRYSTSLIRASPMDWKVRRACVFSPPHKELIVASSYSKNFGLYNERVGACTIVAADAETADRAFSG